MQDFDLKAFKNFVRIKNFITQPLTDIFIFQCNFFALQENFKIKNNHNNLNFLTSIKTKVSVKFHYSPKAIHICFPRNLHSQVKGRVAPCLEQRVRGAGWKGVVASCTSSLIRAEMSGIQAVGIYVGLIHSRACPSRPITPFKQAPGKPEQKSQYNGITF